MDNNGNVWFTNQTNAKIGEIVIPSSTTWTKQATGKWVAAGKNGTAWIVDSSGNVEQFNGALGSAVSGISNASQVVDTADGNATGVWALSGASIYELNAGGTQFSQMTGAPGATALTAGGTVGLGLDVVTNTAPTGSVYGATNPGYNLAYYAGGQWYGNWGGPNFGAISVQYSPDYPANGQNLALDNTGLIWSVEWPTSRIGVPAMEFTADQRSLGEEFRDWPRQDVLRYRPEQ